jgi:beta-lactamase class A
LGDTNIRFGPGVEYPSIVEVPADTRLPVIELHALFPWVRVSLPDSPTGNGWVFTDLVKITGDTSQVPVTNAIQFTVPELTPTPQMVVVDGAPWKNADPAPGTLASTLGEEMHSYLMEQSYVPFTDQFASVFVMDLSSGDTFTLNGGIAYSGMSLTKIPILVTYFQRHSGPVSSDDAFLIADTMMCSENITTNSLLELIGQGDMLRGAQEVTSTMQRLGLNSIFILRQYVISQDEPPMNLGTTIHTGADQSSARPDMYNQVVPEELGWLLAGIYQCAENESGLLMERFPNDFDAQECRQMLYTLDANEIGVFLEAGVPEGTRVLHKHGWIGDTHGDAGIVVEADRAYVFVAVLYNQDWLQFEYSAPVIAELSRLTWNALNPDNLLEAAHPETVPAVCDPRNDPVMQALASEDLPMIGP